MSLQPYKQSTIKQKKNHKLASKFYGPYKILHRIGDVDYELCLPSYCIHMVLHVSFLKQFFGTNDANVYGTSTIRQRMDDSWTKNSDISTFSYSWKKSLYGVDNKVEECASRRSYIIRWEIHDENPLITSLEGKDFFKQGGYGNALMLIHY